MHNFQSRWKNCLWKWMPFRSLVRNLLGLSPGVLPKERALTLSSVRASCIKVVSWEDLSAAHSVEGPGPAVLVTPARLDAPSWSRRSIGYALPLLEAHTGNALGSTGSTIRCRPRTILMEAVNPYGAEQSIREAIWGTKSCVEWD